MGRVHYYSILVVGWYIGGACATEKYHDHPKSLSRACVRINSPAMSHLLLLAL